MVRNSTENMIITIEVKIKETLGTLKKAESVKIQFACGTADVS